LIVESPLFLLYRTLHGRPNPSKAMGFSCGGATLLNSIDESSAASFAFCVVTAPLGDLSCVPTGLSLSEQQRLSLSLRRSLGDFSFHVCSAVVSA